MSQEKLLAEITNIMSDQEAAGNEGKIESVLSKIRALNPAQTNDKLKLASCHGDKKIENFPWEKKKIVHDNMTRMGGGNTQLDMDVMEEFKAAQRQDMELGWKLLDVKGNSTAAQTARILKIEVAQRLEDSFKLEEAFDDLMKRQMSEEEVMVAFTAAPFLGDWKAMFQLGDKVEQTPGGLEQLHAMSLQLPIPDFSLIYELAKEHKLHNQKRKSPQEMEWNLFNVEKVRVKFKDVDCGPFEGKRTELLEEIKKQGDAEWEDVPNCEHVHIKRMGGLCQAVSFGENPIMLNGPWFDEKIHVKGRTEMPLMSEEEQLKFQEQMQFGMPSPDSLSILVQEEEWILDKDKSTPTVYRGTYTLKQRPELPPSKEMTDEHAPVNMSFECEVYLKSDTGSKSVHKKKEENKTERKSADEDEKYDKSDGNNEKGLAENIESTDDKIKDESLVTEFDGLELD
ncbi:hypothetical protein RFI_03121 [Reticulomyxa filosa]|uniref:Uncharacterized protein n=1 Tax=Reticulomyxa filosa TaxID=46433 RepID=X6P777_RETFI|nr:hypothetical protein RFI_03121 [Reticulomyxa filosa]|eukprot:ETO33973.1 hypothetical protein RFI_03121 [Reticulomyxa filosa]